MNIDIKFKFWIKKTKTMGPPITLWEVALLDWDNSDILDLTPLQYIGIKDIKDVEIYDGDILIQDRYPFFDEGKKNYVAYVERDFASFCSVMECVNPDRRGISSGIAESIEHDQEWQVIGNIYENPELIQLKKE